MAEYVTNQPKVNQGLQFNLELPMYFTTKYNEPIQRRSRGAEQVMEGLAMKLIRGHKGACHKTVPNSGGAGSLRTTMVLYPSWLTVSYPLPR